MIVYTSTPIGAENGLFLNILGGDEFLLLQKLHQLRQLLEGSLVPLQAALSTHVATIFASLPPPTHTILAGEVRVHELAARQVLAVEGGHLHRQVLATHLVQALPLTAPRRAYADAQVQELVVHLLLAHLPRRLARILDGCLGCGFSDCSLISCGGDFSGCGSFTDCGRLFGNRFVTLHLHRRRQQRIDGCGCVALGSRLCVMQGRDGHSVGVRVEQRVAIEMDHLDHLPLLRMTADAKENSRGHHFGEVPHAAVADGEGLGIVEGGDRDDRFHQQRRHALFLSVRNRRKNDGNHNARNHKASALQNLATHEGVRVDHRNDCRRLPQRED